MEPENINKIRVKEVFPIINENYLIVHLFEDDWDFNSRGVAVVLIVGDEYLDFKYVGFMNVGNMAALVLKPLMDTKPSTLDRVKELLGWGGGGENCWLMRPVRK